MSSLLRAFDLICHLWMYTFEYKNVVSVSEISAVNLIVGWKLFDFTRKTSILSLLVFHIDELKLFHPRRFFFHVKTERKKLVKWNSNTYHQCRRRRQPLRKTAVGRKRQLEGEHICSPLFLLCRNLEVAAINLRRKLKRAQSCHAY